MPNWCANSAKFTGPTGRIQELYEVAKIGSMANGLLNAIRPQPKDLDEGNESMAPAWYRWRLDNWDTKWDVDCINASVVDNDDGTSTLSVEFDSAWSPPTGVYEYATEQGLIVEAWYHEPGMQYAGMYTSQLGDHSMDYGSCNSDTVREFVGTVLDDKFGISKMLAECEED